MIAIPPWKRLSIALGCAIAMSSAPVIVRLWREFNGDDPVSWDGVALGTTFCMVGFAALFYRFPNLLSGELPTWFLRALSKLVGDSKR